MDITLFHFPGACSQVTMIALEQAGLEFTDIGVDLMPGAREASGILEHNPQGKVPTLVVDGVTITESPAIQMFIDRLRPEAGLLPHDDDGQPMIQAVSDLAWVSSTLHVIARMLGLPIRFTTGADEEGVRERARELGKLQFGVLNDRLTGREWIYGNNWSIVDSYIGWAVDVASFNGMPLDAYPAIRDHAQRLIMRPVLHRVLLREQAARERHGIMDPRAK